MYLDIVNAVVEAVETQIDRNDGSLSGISRIDNVSKGDTTCYSGYVAILNLNFKPTDDRIKAITDSIDKGNIPGCVSEVFRFNDVDVSNANTKEFQDAMCSLRNNRRPLQRHMQGRTRALRVREDMADNM